MEHTLIQGSHMNLNDQLASDMKDAMRAGEKQKLAVIRSIRAAIKQKEIDEQTTLDDDGVMAMLQKLSKQRKDSIQQFTEAGRDDLVAQEASELAILSTYLPEQMDEAAIDQAIQAAIAQTGASSMADMGKLMGVLKPQLNGKADMGLVSARVKAAFQ